MPVAVITPPEPLVDLDLAKQHLRCDDSDSDDLINAYIAAAQANIDGPGGWLGRAIGLQTLELRLDSFSAQDWSHRGRSIWDEGAWSDWSRWPFESRIKLPYPPLVSITSIIYEDFDGQDQTLTSAGWKPTDDGVEPSWDMPWPGGRVDADAVRIQYQAGYETTPAPVVAAILLMVGDMFSNREAVVIDTRAAVIQNPTVEALLTPFRVYTV